MTIQNGFRREYNHSIYVCCGIIAKTLIRHNRRNQGTVCLVNCHILYYCISYFICFTLIITNEPDMVSDLIDLGLFPGSDHNAILWRLVAATTRDQVSRQILDYSKADVKAVKQELKSVNWQNLFENLSADQSWAVFKDKLENLQWKYITHSHG